MEGKILKNQKGFSLAEILVAIILFSIFGTGFFINQSGNITNSNRMGELLILHNLCERKMNEIMINPPEFNDTLENDIKEKEFEEDQYQDYRYRIEFRKLELPSFKKLLEAQSEEEGSNNNSNEGDGGSAGASQAIIKQVFEKIEENLKKVLWQVIVTVENTQSKRKYSLSSWIEDKNQKIEITL